MERGMKLAANSGRQSRSTRECALTKACAGASVGMPGCEYALPVFVHEKEYCV